MFPYIFMFNKSIPMYGLCVVIGVLVAFVFAVIKCKIEKLCWENIVIIGTCGVGVGFICAKLLYIFISFTPNDLINIIKHNGIFLIFNGGFVFYGGLIGGSLGVLLGSKIAQTKISVYENILIMSVPLAHFFGRLGCLCAGCCYGKPTNTAFGVIYTNPIGNTPVGIALIPVQVYEAIYNLIIFFILIYVEKRCKKNHILIAIYLLLYGIGRFVLEFFRYDYTRGIYFGMSTSQFISIIILFIAAALFLKKDHS